MKNKVFDLDLVIHKARARIMQKLKSIHRITLQNKRCLFYKSIFLSKFKIIIQNKIHANNTIEIHFP